MSKITHEQAREGLLQVYVYNDIHTNEANYVLIKDYITQQEEQEKLLELYKEYFKYSEMLKDGRKFGGRMLVEHERDKVSEEIKEIENEL